ncbi:MAG: NADH-quinone oxidoreductase subunit NuoF [Acidobacteriota bacterium]
MSYEPVLIAGCDDPDNVTLKGYEKRGGYATAKKVLKNMAPDEVVTQVKDSGLRGRGGAGFPTGLKWTFLAKDTGKPTYLAVNADESEPGTFKDRYLLERNPHQLIEGCLIAAWAIQAHDVYIYLRGEFPYGRDIVQAAIDECYEKGYLGDKVFGKDFRCNITTVLGAGAYICGEETGMLESLEGKRGHPRNKPPFPAVEGLFNCPTIINNVESLSVLVPILERGNDWFQSLGSEKNWGPKVWCVSGHVKKPGIYETALGLTINELLEEHCGGCRDGHSFKSAVPGGSSCGIVKASEFDTALDFDALREVGSSLGTGGVMAWDDTTSIPEALANFIEFYAEESCGQCTPCRQGTGWAAGILHRLVHGHYMDGDFDELERIARGFTGTTICALADAAAIPIHSYLAKFPEEFKAMAERAHALTTGA